MPDLPADHPFSQVQECPHDGHQSNCQPPCESGTCLKRPSEDSSHQCDGEAEENDKSLNSHCVTSVCVNLLAPRGAQASTTHSKIAV